MPFNLRRKDPGRELVPVDDVTGSPEPVFVEQEPVINHPPEAWHYTVPWPYRFKWDGGWLFVLFLVAGGFAFQPLWLLAGFIAVLRCLVWLSFRFPMTMIFLTAFISGLLGGGRRRLARMMHLRSAMSAGGWRLRARLVMKIASREL